MKTTAIWIFASIFGGVAVILAQTNHLTLSIWFGILSIASLLFSLLTHQKETKTPPSVPEADKTPGREVILTTDNEELKKLMKED